MNRWTVFVILFLITLVTFFPVLMSDPLYMDLHRFDLPVQNPLQKYAYENPVLDTYQAPQHQDTQAPTFFLLTEALDRIISFALSHGWNPAIRLVILLVHLFSAVLLLSILYQIFQNHTLAGFSCLLYLEIGRAHV